MSAVDPPAAGHAVGVQAEGFQVRPYQRGDEPAILAGFARAFPTRRSIEHWQAIYDASPDGARIMLGLAGPGEVAAHYAATAHRGIRAGAPALLGHVRDVFSVPRYRGLRGGRHGVFVRTGRAFYDTWGRDFCALFGFPSPRSFRVGEILMGYRRFSRWLALRLPLAGQSPASGPGGTVSPVTAFDARFDDLWRRRAARISLGVARDARFLSWRFAGIEARRYWAWTLATYLEPGIAGRVVVRPEGDTALLMDWCLPNDPRLAASFWRQVAERLAARGVRAVQTWLSPSVPEARVLPALGFLEAPTRPDIVPCFITFQPDLAPDWIDEHLCFTMADSDLSYVADAGETFDPVVYALETPAFHRVRLGEHNTFAGWVFHQAGHPIRRVRARRARQEIGLAEVNLRRDDIARHVPYLPAAQAPGFRLDLAVDPGEPIDLDLVYADGAEAPLLSYDVPAAFRDRGRGAGVRDALDAIPVPEADLVFATQGHRHVSLYRDSSLWCATGVIDCLAAAGRAAPPAPRVLDFGCGTGRMLAGWHAWDATARLAGCEISSRLAAWAQRHLPAGIDVRRTGFAPPLPFADGAFDVVCAISVFTHLSLASQQAWALELRRVLAPGGTLVVTLHGELYARHACRDDLPGLAVFFRDGHLERPHAVEGSNEFAAFHAAPFARRLFDGLSPRGCFPGGRLASGRPPFLIAQAQDVHVFGTIA